MTQVLLFDIETNKFSLSAGAVLEDSDPRLGPLLVGGAVFAPFVALTMQEPLERFLALRKTDSETSQFGLFAALFLVTRVRAQMSMTDNIVVTPTPVGAWVPVAPWEQDLISYHAINNLTEGTIETEILAGAQIFGTLVLNGSNNVDVSLALFEIIGEEATIVAGTILEFELQGNGKPFPISFGSTVITRPGVKYQVRLRHDESAGDITIQSGIFLLGT